MANFELDINSRVFKQVGVHVNFDENRYGALLDALVTIVPEEKSPQLYLTPAPIWNMSKSRQFLAVLGRDDSVYPSSKYSPVSQTLLLKLDEQEPEANRLLLSATRRWSGDLNGELADSREYARKRRFLRQGILATPIGAGAIAGYEISDGIGAFLGGVAGLAVGITGEIIEISKSPYDVAIRSYVNNPEVLAEYGRIISYKAV